MQSYQGLLSIHYPTFKSKRLTELSLLCHLHSGALALYISDHLNLSATSGRKVFSSKMQFCRLSLICLECHVAVG